MSSKLSLDPQVFEPPPPWSVWLSKKQVYEKGLASIFLWSSFVLGDYRKIHQEPGLQFEENIRRLREDDLSKTPVTGESH